MVINALATDPLNPGVTSLIIAISLPVVTPRSAGKV
jgi:hypothetical protein